MPNTIKNPSKKLSPPQAELLILIDDHSVMEGPYWHPVSNEPRDYRHGTPDVDKAYSPTLGRKVIVEGAGSAASLRALESKGLIEFHPEFKSLYWSRITEEGRLLIEKWRESDKWPVKVRETQPAKWKVPLIWMYNNTDYQAGIGFVSVNDIKAFINWYYNGEEGDQYTEEWKVPDDYTDDIFDVLSPPQYDGDTWKRK